MEGSKADFDGRDMDGQEGLELITEKDECSNKLKDKGCIPLFTNMDFCFDTNEVYNILCNGATKHRSKLCTLPPVQPRGGCVFLYDLSALGPISEWNQRKQQLR